MSPQCRLVVFALASAAVLGPVASAPAARAPTAHAASACPSVAYAGRSYVLYRERVGCTFAKRWVRRLHSTGLGPRRWRCETGSDYATGGMCSRGRRLFGWHPYD